MLNSCGVLICFNHFIVGRIGCAEWGFLMKLTIVSMLWRWRCGGPFGAWIASCCVCGFCSTCWCYDMLRLLALFALLFCSKNLAQAQPFWLETRQDRNRVCCLLRLLISWGWTNLWITCIAKGEIIWKKIKLKQPHRIPVIFFAGFWDSFSLAACRDRRARGAIVHMKDPARLENYTSPASISALMAFHRHFPSSAVISCSFKTLAPSFHGDQ